METSTKKELKAEKRKLKKEKRLTNKEAMRNANRKYLKNGSYSTVISVFFIAIVVAVNLIVGKIPAKYTEIDVSEEQLYSIGNETKNVLREMEKDVTIYHITTDQNKDMTISKLLEKYEDETKHIQVEQKDPVVNPKFVSEYTSDQVESNSLIVVSGERSKVVPNSSMYQSEIDYSTYSYQTTGFDGEGQITGAIAYVISENLPVLYTLEGHGEMELDTSYTREIEKANMEIKELNLLTEEKVPDDSACLLIASPRSDLSETECEVILDYLEKGGKAVFFTDYEEIEMPNLDGILANYGVKRADGIVIEGDSRHYAMQMPYFLVPTVKSTALSSDMAESGYYTLMPYAQGIVKDENARDTLSITSMLTTSDQAYAKADLNAETLEKEKNDLEGPFDLGVYISEEETEGKTEIVYFSTGNILDASVNSMVSGGNQKLFMEALLALCETEEAANVSIPVKSLSVSYLNMTEYDSSFWKIWVIGIIPTLFLAAGFTVWMKRRKA